MKNQGICNAVPLELAVFLGNQTSSGNNQTVWLSVVGELGEPREHPRGALLMSGERRKLEKASWRRCQLTRGLVDKSRDCSLKGGAKRRLCARSRN